MPPGHLHDVLPALLRKQVDLAADLSTPRLAAATGMSPSHFHEVFRRATGETVKQYTLRLQERAAFRLLTERTSVAAIAFDLGFGSHETFTRAFAGPARWRPRNIAASCGHRHRRWAAQPRLCSHPPSGAYRRPRPSSSNPLTSPLFAASVPTRGSKPASTQPSAGLGWPPSI